MNKNIVYMKAHGHILIFSFPVVVLSLALGDYKHEPPGLAAIPPVVIVSPPVKREITDHYEYTARTAPVESVEVRAWVSGYLVKVNYVQSEAMGECYARLDRAPIDFTTVPRVGGDDYSLRHCVLACEYLPPSRPHCEWHRN
ncbi:MAG: hypothetical protein AB7P18_15215 [Candidatus Binatia bacterium]